MKISYLPTSEDRPEAGVAIVVVALLLVVALVFIAIVLNVGYSNVVDSELQAAADAAALTAAGTLCSTKTCWANSKLAAIEALERHRLSGGLGVDSSVTFSAAERAAGPVWDFGALRITIERGRWWVSERRFESFDEPGWQNNNPGLPQIIGVNAIRVRIERPEVEVFFSPLGGAQPLRYALAGEAIASAGKQGEVCVGPFALPACSLLDASGDFDPAQACRFDRLFTESDRYCPAGTDCDVLPGAFWNPSQVDPSTIPQGSMSGFGFTTENCPPFFWASDLAEVWHCPHHETGGAWQPNYTQYQLHSLMTGMDVFDSTEATWQYSSVKQYWTAMPKLFGRASKFNMPRMPTVGDHYGVIGLPVGSAFGEIDGTNDEEKVRNVLMSEPPCVTAEIGQKFKVLGAGLTDPLTDEAIWNKVRDSAGAGGEMHPRFGDTDLGWPMVAFKHRWNHPSWGMQPMWDPPPEGENRSHYFDESNAYGACNSRVWGYRGMRGEAVPRAWTSIPAQAFDHQFDFYNGLEHDDVAYRNMCYSPNTNHFGHYEDVFVTEAVDAAGVPLEEQMPVLEISVPIISESCRDLTVQSCQGVTAAGIGSGQDPLIDPTKEYEICGFIKVNIFDVDIGFDPPTYPRAQCSQADFDASNPLNGRFWDSPAAHYPWGFDVKAQASTDPVDREPTRCNAVRSRPVCDTRLVASTQHKGRPTPTLVE